MVILVKETGTVMERDNMEESLNKTKWVEL